LRLNNCEQSIADHSLPSPLESRHVAVEDEIASFDEDLAWIIRQYKERVQASAVVVTIHYLDGRPPEIHVRDGDGRLPVDTVGGAAWFEAPLAAGAREWREASDHMPWHRMLVDLASNHCSRAVISAFYAPEDKVQPSAVDFIASRFQPVLTGYFKLWLLHRSTSRRMQTVIAALAPVDFGVIVVDRDARIVFENPAATAILEDGSALHRCRGSVCAHDARAGVRLRLAIDRALTGRKGTAAADCAGPNVFVKSRRHPAPLIAAVNAVEQLGVGEDDPAAVIHLFQPPTAIDRMIAPACQWYRLSPAETRLVTALLAGGTVAEMAAKESVKPDTLRTYLKNIFRKTRTRSQADLVRAMLAVSVRLTRF
jgi:DNA-binding CsgD family transcriptional regulator/PAS domain-containing protein